MTEYELETVTGPDTLDQIQRTLDGAWAAADVSDEAQFSIELAASEIASNIIEYAGGERPVRLRMVITTQPESVLVSFTDDGDPSTVDLSRVVMPDPTSEGHRGLAIAQSVLDDLSYRRDAMGNHWTLSRLRSDAIARPSDGVGSRPPASPSSSVLARRSAIPDAVFISVALVVVLLVVGLSSATQPAALATAAWWPTAGIGLGLGLRYQRRYSWVLALGVAAVTLSLSLWAGRPVVLFTALAVLGALEMVMGVMLLRGRRDVLPALATPRDLGKLLAVVLFTAAMYDLAASGTSFVLGDHAGAWARLVTSFPKHAAGMLLITPLFMELPRRPRRAGYVESAAQIMTVLVVAVSVLAVNSLPLSFLTFVPLVWAAMRMSTRTLLIEMLGVAVIASIGSSHGTGPFSFERYGPATGTLVLQVFQLSMAVVFLALSLTVGKERDTATRLAASEDLFRKSFNSAVAGKMMVTRDATGWTVERYNHAAMELLPGLGDGVMRLQALVGGNAAEALSAAADAHVEDHTRFTMALTDGRTLDVSLAAITEQRDGKLFALHFHDITDELRTRQLEQDELQRGADMQRALLPGQLPETPGWTYGAMAAPARQVGGDFYDLRLMPPFMAVSLGDVMGKGVGAGMLAAATRATLRSHHADISPADVVNRAARVLEDDLERAGAFVTLAYVLVDLDCGKFRFTDAGHGLCFLVRAGTCEVERLATDGLPLGVGTSWHEVTSVLDPGDTVLLVSDGVLDLWGGSLAGLLDAIARTAKSYEAQPQAFVDALCSGIDDTLDRDDLSAVALRREGAEIPVPR